MLAETLERYLHEHIPLSAAMRVSVLAVEERSILLHAPLEPNINHRETVFGGSASALAILAAWSLLHVRLRRDGIDCRLVIQRNTMEYERPIPGAFTARAALDGEEAWPRFTRLLVRRGRARIAVSAVLAHGAGTVGRFGGEFVALRARDGMVPADGSV
jgi:thioesterase domain-containing protein